MHREEPADDAHQEPDLVSGVDRVRDLMVELERLLEVAVVAIPATVGVSLVILLGTAPQMTMSALRPGRQGEAILASLSVLLPRPRTWPSADGRAELVIYAGTPQAFDDTVPSLLALLDATAGNVTRDAHLRAPDLAAERAALAQWLDDQIVINRALGVLLGHGLLPADGRRELARRATAAGTSAVEVARTLITATTVDDDPG